MKHTPWTKEEAEAMAYNVVVKSGCTEENDKMRIAEGFYACLTWAAEMIEEIPSIYCSKPDGVSELWTHNQCEGHDTHSAKLVGVRPIEGEK